MSLGRVCMITTFYPPSSFGGDAVAVQNLAHALADDGSEVTVVHCSDSYRVLAGGTPRHTVAGHDGVEVVALSGRIPLASPAASYLTGRPGPKTRRLREILESGQFDVTHFHNVSLFGPAVLHLGTGVRLLTIHDHWLVCPTHVLWQDGRRRCQTPHCLRCLARAHRPPQPWRYTSLIREALGAVDAVLAPSQFVVDEHARRGLRLEATVLPAFVPEPAQPRGELDRARFAYVGRLEPLKGILELVDVFTRAPDLGLVIAGDGTLDAEVRRRVASTANIRVAGRLDRAGLDELYASSCAVVVPSVGYEVAPLVAIESFAHGTPVVARRLGGLVEHLEPAGGLLFDRDDEIVPLLRRLRDDATHRASLSRSARAAYEARHTVRAHLHAYEAIVARARLRMGPPGLEPGTYRL